MSRLPRLKIPRPALRKLSALVCLAALMIPLLAQAGWKQKELRWTLSGVTGDGSGIYIRDTTKVVLGGGTTTLDTTAWFTVSDATPVLRGAQDLRVVNGSLAGAAGNDTTIIGWLVFQADSSAAPTATLTTMTMIIEGRGGGFGLNTSNARGWVKVDSVVVNGSAGATGLETVIAPLRTIGAITGQNTANNLSAFEQLRARVLTATGILSSARVFVRYWKPNESREN